MIQTGRYESPCLKKDIWHGDKNRGEESKFKGHKKRRSDFGSDHGGAFGQLCQQRQSNSMINIVGKKSKHQKDCKDTR